MIRITRLEGLEPSTPDFGDLRSTNWTKDAKKRFILFSNNINSILSNNKRESKKFLFREQRNYEMVEKWFRKDS